jgi:hypothetical protein
VTWPAPELDDGADPGLRPPDVEPELLDADLPPELTAFDFAVSEPEL